jgi:hypothetical protein
MSHRCPGRGCKATVDDRQLMCGRHWHMVPKPLQLAVYRAYSRGRGLGTEALRHAQDAAIRSVNDKLAHTETS